MSAPDYSDLKQPWLLRDVCQMLAWGMLPLVLVIKLFGKKPSWFWKLIVVLCVLGGFCILSSYSWAITHTPWRHVMEDRVKPVVIWRTHRAALLAEVYGLTPEEVNKPIGIWGKR